MSTQPPIALESVAFRGTSDLLLHHAFDTRGRPLAAVRTRSFSRKFEVTWPDGTPMCAGTPRRRRRRYLVRDPEGRLLCTVRTWLRSAGRQTIRLPDGTRFHARKHRRSLTKEDWTVTDQAGRVVLNIQPAADRARSAIDDVDAVLGDPRWSVPLLVGFVFASRSEARANRLWDVIDF